MSIFQPITSSVRWRTEVFKIKGFVRKRFLRSPPPPRSFLFLLSPHFSRGRNAENPVFRSFLHGNACYAGYSRGDLFFFLPLLLATPTMQFPLDHKRRSHKKNNCSANFHYFWIILLGPFAFKESSVFLTLWKSAGYNWLICIQWVHCLCSISMLRFWIFVLLLISKTCVSKLSPQATFLSIYFNK